MTEYVVRRTVVIEKVVEATSRDEAVTKFGLSTTLKLAGKGDVRVDDVQVLEQECLGTPTIDE